MLDHALPCCTDARDARPIHAVRPDGLEALRASLPAFQRGFLEQAGFAAAVNETLLLPGPDGVAGSVLGLGGDRSPFAFGGLAKRLPQGSWKLLPGDFDASEAVLGFCLGGYDYTAFKPAKRPSARLVVAEGGHARARSLAAATWMVRDLINAPANLLGPAELADVAVALAHRHGASVTRIEGAALEQNYPAIAAVGNGSERPPVVVSFAWRGSSATDSSPLISFCGKGVCFDTGGLDIKPSSGMMRMKKDMGGAATVLGMARVLMEADLPIRLAVRIGCVENAISGRSFRPLDVIRTRRGLSVEVGNTDAEGRLVLCDLLAEASDERPDLLLDCATLTGAARVALGPDLPALFVNDEEWAAALLEGGTASFDPLWRLPLWDGYDPWLDSSIADLNNISTKPLAGAVVAALFLRRFLVEGTKWAHLDLYAWNDTSRSGRPEGGEAMGLRAVCAAIERKLALARGA